MAAMSSLASDAGDVPHEGGRQGGAREGRHRVRGFLLNAIPSFFLAQTCSFFSREMHGATLKPAREDGWRRWEHEGWKHKTVMCFSGWKEAQVIK